jgi:Ca2+-binding EF-hand superfamily protein
MSSSYKFTLFDLDKDLYIDYHELKIAVRALGFEISKTELLHIVQTHGVPASSIRQPGSKAPIPQQQQQQQKSTFSGPSRLLLSRATFLNLAAQRMLARDPREEILRAFALFDADNKGRIELADLRRVARDLGEGIPEEEMAAMIEEFDILGEGGVNAEEFVGICLGD